MGQRGRLVWRGGVPELPRVSGPLDVSPAICAADDLAQVVEQGETQLGDNDLDVVEQVLAIGPRDGVRRSRVTTFGGNSAFSQVRRVGDTGFEPVTSSV